MIYISASSVKPTNGKSASTGFTPKKYNSLEELAEAMHTLSHSPSIYSSMLRYDPYSGKFVHQRRRRLHNISFVGNVLAYDFDDGSLSFDDAIDVFRATELPTLLIRSRSDPDYNYDRFKAMVVTQMMYPKYWKDAVPPGFEKVRFENYTDVYLGFAVKYGFISNIDKSTKDASRLIAPVVKKTYERREYVIL